MTKLIYHIDEQILNIMDPLEELFRQLYASKILHIVLAVFLGFVWGRHYQSKWAGNKDE